MSRQGFAQTAGGTYYVLQEITAGSSSALGIDVADNKLKIHVANGTGTLPDNSSQIIIDPTTNVVTIPNLSAAVAMIWNEITAASATMSVNNGYIANRATLVTLTLPATAVQGSMFYISGKGAGLFSIAQNAGQTIHFGTLNSTLGAGGSVSSTAQYDNIALLCITANTDFVVTTSIGNFTIV